MKVLIVDDSKTVCNGLQQMLNNIPGVEIAGQAHNGKDAIKSILESKPDVVILDIRLNGGITGIDVLKRIKKEILLPIVVMLTNYPYPQYREKCLALGAEYFFDKVTDIEVIPVLIEKLAKNKPENVKKKQ